MTRRDLLRLLLASAAAEAVDFEKLLWVPKPIVTVPELRRAPRYILYSPIYLVSPGGWSFEKEFEPAGNNVFVQRGWMEHHKRQSPPAKVPWGDTPTMEWRGRNVAMAWEL